MVAHKWFSLSMDHARSDHFVILQRGVELSGQDTACGQWTKKSTSWSRVGNMKRGTIPMLITIKVVKDVVCVHDIFIRFSTMLGKLCADISNRLNQRPAWDQTLKLRFPSTLKHFLKGLSRTSNPTTKKGIPSDSHQRYVARLRQTLYAWTYTQRKLFEIKLGDDARTRHAVSLYAFTECFFFIQLGNLTWVIASEGSWLKCRRQLCTWNSGHIAVGGLCAGKTC